jgi:hydroxyethylthiazole kinase-like uncharacterized protein yjeF
MKLPYLTGAELKTIDERAETEFGVPLAFLMETAGTNMARFLKSTVDIRGKKILIVCGKGNNGGDGFVMARILHGWGQTVSLLPAFDRDDLQGVVLENFKKCEDAGVPLVSLDESPTPQIVVDCLFGFSFHGFFRDDHKEIVGWINGSSAQVLSCDLPSGMNSEVYDPDRLTVVATWTLTFTVPKVSLKDPASRQRTGELFLLDIGIPQDLYRELGVMESPFLKNAWVKLQ